MKARYNTMVRDMVMDALSVSHPDGLAMGEIAAECEIDVKNIRQVVYRMRDEDDSMIVADDQHRYYLSDRGLDEVCVCRRVSPGRWIRNVRMGIDASGRQTKIKNAKTPSVAEIRDRSTPDIEDWIDQRRLMDFV